MTSLGSKPSDTVRIMEGEFSMFCRLSAEVSAALQCTNIRAQLVDIHELRDELDLLSEMTEWPAIRKSTRSTIDRIDCFLVDQPTAAFA